MQSFPKTTGIPQSLLQRSGAVNDEAAPAQGWSASLRLCFARQGERTVLVRKRQSGPLTVQRPFYPEGAPCHLYVLHPPGGVVGGDRLRLDLAVGMGGHALLTTPGAGKFYRSAGPMAQQRQQFEVASDAILEWLPQETILFDGAKARLSTRVDLHGDARYMGWEIFCLGRPAAGETFASGDAGFGLELRRDRSPLLIERLDLAQGRLLNSPVGLRGQPVTATFLATHAANEDLDEARRVMDRYGGVTAGATLLDDVLVLRCLGDDGQALRNLLVDVWSTLRPRLLGLPASHPRIWAT